MSATSNPLKYGVAYFFLATLELVVRMPLETIRRRLHLQPPVHRTSFGVVINNPTPLAAGLRSCLRTSEEVYYSPLDCAWRIINDEAIGTSPILSTDKTVVRKKRTLKKTLWSGWLGGWAQLYRGFLSQMGVNAMMAVLSVVSGLELVDERDTNYF